MPLHLRHNVGRRRRRCLAGISVDGRDAHVDGVGAERTSRRGNTRAGRGRNKVCRHLHFDGEIYMWSSYISVGRIPLLYACPYAL